MTVAGPILSTLVANLRAAAEDNLVGVALYGGLAKGRYTPGISDVNVLIVVRDSSLGVLEQLAPVLTAARRAHRVSAFIATPEDLRETARLFPVKMMDIQNAHRVLHGDVSLGSIEIDRVALRLRTLQEIKNTEFRLRQRTVERGADATVLWGGLVQSLPKLAVTLESVLWARGMQVPSDRPGALLAAARALGIPNDTIEPFARIHRHEPPPDDPTIRKLVSGYLDLLRALSDAVARVLAT